MNSGSSEMTSSFELNSIVATMERVISKCEAFLRGGLSKMLEEEVNNTKLDAYYLYDIFYSGHNLQLSEDSKRSLLEISIKLHNKIRNLPSNLLEIKAILKASCAWAFASLSEKHDKVSVIVIKLLRKAGDELEHLNIIDKAMDCFLVATNLWSAVQNASYIDHLPPLEVQDLKLSIFSSHLQILKLTNLEDNSVVKMKEHLQCALSLLPYLNIKNKLNLVEILASIASKLSIKKEFHTVAINIFDKCIEIMDNKEVPHDNVDTQEQEAKWKQTNTIKLRCYLSMAYMFLMNGDITRAWAAISCADNLQKNVELNLNHSICYAKIVLCVKENLLDKADEHVKTLIRMQTAPFKTLISAVNQYFNSISDSVADIPSKITEVYKLLANRKLSDMESVSVRINHLKTTLRVLMNKSDDSQLEERARQLAIRLFSSVSQEEIILNDTENEQITNLIKEQIKIFRANESWAQVRQWCDIILSHLNATGTCVQRNITCSIFKVEALMRLHQYAEALDTAFKAVTKQVTTQTILMYFQTMLLVDDISEDELLRRLQLQQDRVQNTPSLSSSDTTNCSFFEDKYGQIMLCLSYVNSPHADNIPNPRRNLVSIYTIKYLLNLLLQNMDLLTNIDTSAVTMSVLKLSKAYLGQYMSVAMGCSDVNPRQDNSEDKQVNSDQNTLDISHQIILLALENNEKKVWKFRTHLLELAELIVPIANRISTLFSPSIVQQILGTSEEFAEIADTFAAIGYYLATSAHKNCLETVKKAFLLAGSDILVQTARLYNCITEENSCKQQEARCLVTSAASLLDIAAMMSPQSSDFEDLIAGNNSSNNDNKIVTTDNKELTFAAIHSNIRIQSEAVQALLYDQLEYNDPVDCKLFSLAVLMQISSLCRSGNIGNCEAEVRRMMPQLSALDMEDMKNCIDMFTMSQNVSTESFRVLLGIAEHICLQTVPVHKATGYVFAKELQLSASRTTALKKVEQFAKLLENPANAMAIQTEDIEFIAANAHNAAMSLNELGQDELAIRFNSTAMKMIPYIGRELQDDWINRMKALQAVIQNREEDLSVVIPDASDGHNHEDQNKSSQESARKRQRLNNDKPKTPDRVGPLRVEDFEESFRERN